MPAAKPTLQSYPRISGEYLAAPSLFPKPKQVMLDIQIEAAIDHAFERCLKNKKGTRKIVANTPEKLVDICIKHLKERSDPIIGSYFVSQCKAEELFEYDAVSHEMQRHRMTIGIFYQYLLLELMKARWIVFDGYNEGDIVADIETPGFEPGLRLYMSVKKSKDTVGGQDIAGVIRRLENLAKEERNLTRPYLCVLCVATPSKAKIQAYEKDRMIKTSKDGRAYSANCEYWGPGFVFPYITGKHALEIYMLAIKRVSDYLPFMSLEFKQECSLLLAQKLADLKLLNDDGTLDSYKFLEFSLHK
jgi:hypothetical protein